MGNIFEVKNTGEMKLKSFTSNPTVDEGTVIYNSTDKKLRYYDGTDWADTGGDSQIGLDAQGLPTRTDFGWVERGDGVMTSQTGFNSKRWTTANASPMYQSSGADAASALAFTGSQNITQNDTYNQVAITWATTDLTAGSLISLTANGTDSTTHTLKHCIYDVKAPVGTFEVRADETTQIDLADVADFDTWGTAKGTDPVQAYNRVGGSYYNWLYVVMKWTGFTAGDVFRIVSKMTEGSGFPNWNRKMFWWDTDISGWVEWTGFGTVRANPSASSRGSRVVMGDIGHIRDGDDTIWIKWSSYGSINSGPHTFTIQQVDKYTGNKNPS